MSKLFVVDQIVDVDDGDSEDLFLHCRSIVDIEVKAAEFKYNKGVALFVV